MAAQVVPGGQVDRRGRGALGLYGKHPVVPGDEVARMRWVADMVPRDVPDRLVRSRCATALIVT
jgi:hypothetical protein